MSRSHLRLLAMLPFLLCGSLADACKDLRHPEHLVEDAHQWRERYLLVHIDRVLTERPVDAHSRLGLKSARTPGAPADRIGLSFEATIIQSFGDADLSGIRLHVEFLQNEEAHAVCPILVFANQRFLLTGQLQGDVLRLSRFDQMNISAEDRKFHIYLADLQGLQAQHRRRRQSHTER